MEAIIIEEKNVEGLVSRPDFWDALLGVAQELSRVGSGVLEADDFMYEFLTRYPNWRLRGQPLTLQSVDTVLFLGRQRPGYLEINNEEVVITSRGKVRLREIEDPSLVPLARAAPVRRSKAPRNQAGSSKGRHIESLEPIGPVDPQAAASADKTRGFHYGTYAEVDGLHISVLGFSDEQISFLHSRGINYVGELRNLTAEKLKELGVDWRRLDIIRAVLFRHGLSLVGEEKLTVRRPRHPFEEELLKRGNQDTFLFVRIVQVNWPEELKRHLRAHGIYIVRDLTQRTAEDLQWLGVVGSNLDLIRQTLAQEFSLTLKGESLSPEEPDPRKERMEKHGFSLTDMLLDLPEPTAREVEQARLLLGEDFHLFDAIRRGSPGARMRARNQLVAKHIRLSWKASYKQPWYGTIVDERKDPALDLDDIKQEMALALLWTFEGYDYTKGLKHSTYAFTWFRQAGTRMLHNSGRVRVPVHQHEAYLRFLKSEQKLRVELGRLPTAQEIQKELAMDDGPFESLQAAIFWIRGRGLSLEGHTESRKAKRHGDEGKPNQDIVTALLHEAKEVEGEEIPGPYTRSAFEAIRQERFAEAVYRVVTASVLLEVDRHVIIRRFGLDGDEPETLEEIGDRLGVSRERIRQREVASIKKLRECGLWGDEIVEYCLANQMSLPEDDDEPASESAVPQPVEEQAAEVQPVEVDPNQKGKITPELILGAVCSYYKTTTEDLLSKNRARPIARWRQVLMYLLREYTHLSLPAIGTLLGRDHTSVLHGHGVINGLVTSQTSPVYGDVQRILAHLNKV